ncbi:hypothetical protein O9X98_08740 [Agrobacterium salinitolerans]|nr:hypothetical protein [Agrobacterium salinitolerans]
MTNSPCSSRAVASFDIFDTLICRLVDRPTDVFELMSETFGPSFASARIRAEADARRHGSSDEISLDEIYARLCDTGMTQELASQARELECALERTLCVRREDMLRVLDERRAHGDRVIGISDMYLSADFVKSLLVGLGIELDAVYVSSDFGATKHTGRLFDLVRELEDIEEGRWTHYGDNDHSDVSVPLSLGINAVHCPIRQSSLHGAVARAEGGAASVVRGIERAASYANPSVGERDRIWFDIGARHTGPIAVMLCAMARETAERTGASHIFFLARDGHVMKRVYETLYPDDNRKIVYTAASRRMINFPLRCHEEPDYVFLSASSVGLTENELLGRIGVKAGEGSPQVIVSDEHAVKVLRAYRDEIVAAARREMEELDGYLHHVGLSGAEDAVLVDVGWFCSIQRSLTSYLASKGHSTRLHGVYVGTNVKEEAGFDARGLFFTNRQPAMESDLVNSALEVMELLFTSAEDSIVSVSRSKGDFDIVRQSTPGESTRHTAAKLIHGGAVAFTKYLSAAGLVHLFSTPEARGSILDDFRTLIENPSVPVAMCASAVQHCVGIGGSDRRPLVATHLTWRKPFGLIEGYQKSFWPAATAKLFGRRERLLVAPLTQSLVAVTKRMPAPVRHRIVKTFRRLSAAL